MELTPQQAEGIEKVKTWYGNAKGYAGATEPFGSFDPFRWFGYAGTGKTFTAARIPEALGLNNVVYGTYTGKAASVLRKSLQRYGVTAPVTTIHSAIYFPTTSKEAREALDLAREELKDLESTKYDLEHLAEQETYGPHEFIVEQGWANLMEFHGRLDEVAESIEQLEANARRLRFEFNPDSDWSLADLIVLDEVSMVNAKLAADIESYGVPILVLGDPAQLPPVEGGGYYTDAEPDHLLTDIQRAALDSPVTELATRIRRSEDRRLGMTLDDMEPRSLTRAMEADVVLVWSNKRRWAMIKAMRDRMGRQEGIPVPGDSIMVLTNNKDAAVFNGELFDVTGFKPGDNGPTLTVINEDGRERELLTFWEGFRGQEEQTRAKNSGMGMRGSRVLATFGQAITVHKSQGSEWDHVYVVNETPAMIEMSARREGMSTALEQARRWLYTATTRAKTEVSITRPR